MLENSCLFLRRKFYYEYQSHDCRFWGRRVVSFSSFGGFRSVYDNDFPEMYNPASQNPLSVLQSHDGSTWHEYRPTWGIYFIKIFFSKNRNNTCPKIILVHRKIAETIDSRCVLQNYFHIFRRNVLIKYFLLKNIGNILTMGTYNISGADLEGGAPGARPLFALICKSKKYICAPLFILISFTVAPPGSIFSGSAPAYFDVAKTLSPFRHDILTAQFPYWLLWVHSQKQCTH